MQVHPITAADDESLAIVDSFTCQRLDDVKQLPQVLDHLARQQAADPAHGYFCTLDDVSQCRYTSGHAGMDERLDLDAGDVDFDDPGAVAEYETRRLHHVAARLQAQALDWPALQGALELLPDEAKALIEINQRPHRILDDSLYVQRVPLTGNDLLIAAMPNGYFHSDLDVFQNHAVIRRMAEHGYHLFGIGASTLGFVRDTPLRQAQALVADVCSLYCIAADESAVREALRVHVETERWLLLGYTESFGETALREDRA